MWWDDDKSRLLGTALAACLDKNNTLLLSMVSIWEMQIKIQLGKLNFTLPLEEKIREQTQTNSLEILPINERHVFALASLPNHYKDPFDRLLIAQSFVENIPLVSGDSQIKQYPIAVLW
jgi:PIN domain nuclease of toxin-antitoxin system